MKKVILKIFLSIFILSTLNCKEEPELGNFNINVREFHGVEGYWLIYKIDQDSINIHYNCDFENCKDTIIYSEKLKQRKLKRFYSYLIENPLDTLKRKYINDGFDGQHLGVTIAGDSLKGKRVYLERYFHPEVEKFMAEIDKLIHVEKYKYHRK